MRVTFGIKMIVGFIAIGCLILFSQRAVWAIPGGGSLLPGSALPDTVGEDLSSRRMPISAQPAAAPVLPTEEKAEGLGGPEAKKITFQLNAIKLVGNHIYSDEQLAILYKHKLHKVISVAELFEIVQNITNFYRNNGYVISRAILPPQHVKNGEVTIQIIEGFIDKVNVTGNPKGAKCIVELYGQKIKEYRPLQIKRMEKYLLIANEIPGTQVKAVLTPSKETIGAADLNLVTQNQPVTFYVSYDNYGTRYIGPLEWTAGLGFNSFATSGDTTRATFTKTTKGGELSYIDINYSLPVADEGKRFLIGGTRVHTHPLFVLQPTQTDGINDNYYTTLSFPVIRTRSQTLSTFINFNYLDSYVTILGLPLYDDHIRSLGLGVSYNFADRFRGANMIYADVRQGLPILGYSSNTDPLTAQTSHPGGRGDYSKVDLQISRVQALFSNFSLYGLIKGQWAANPLLASEQFTFGGSQIGRGYDVAELIGDQGMAGSVELRYDFSSPRFMFSTQLYLFYDAGVIWNSEFLFGTPMKVSATSAGFGARFYFTRFISGNVMWGQPLTKQVAAEQLIGEGWRPRVFFSIVASFA